MLPYTFLAFTSGLMYMGPETIMPLASILAAIIGILLIFWRYITGFIRRTYRRLTGKQDAGISLEDAIDQEMTVSESTPNDPTKQIE